MLHLSPGWKWNEDLQTSETADLQVGLFFLKLKDKILRRAPECRLSESVSVRLTPGVFHAWF